MAVNFENLEVLDKANTREGRKNSPRKAKEDFVYSKKVEKVKNPASVFIARKSFKKSYDLENTGFKVGTDGKKVYLKHVADEDALLWGKAKGKVKSMRITAENFADTLISSGLMEVEEGKDIVVPFKLVKVEGEDDVYEVAKYEQEPDKSLQKPAQIHETEDAEEDEEDEEWE